MATREQLHRLLDELSDGEVAKARIVVEADDGEPDVVGLPAAWGQTVTGEPMPNVVAAVRRIREDH